jgi:predicted amidohydrolase YtcJ
MKHGRINRRIASITALLLAAAVAVGQSAKGPAPDIIVEHGKVYTVDAKNPWAQAVAIRSGRIVVVGDDARIDKLRRPETRVIDAGNRLVLPGFVDSHIHFFEGSIYLDRVHLEGAGNIVEIRKRLRDYAASHSGKGWIVGAGWDYAMFGRATLPTKGDLDELFPDRPVFLDGFDGHTAWVNSKALALAGITKDTRDPPNGTIVRDRQTGEATGALEEDDAIDMVRRVKPRATRAERLAALRSGMRLANQNGLTRVHAAGGHFESNDFDEFDVYDELRRHGDLTLRMYIAYFLDPPELRAQDLDAIEAARQKYSGDWLAGGVVKLRLDGVVESHTAAMLDPYSDDPSVQGTLFWDPEKYKSAVLELDRRGLQLFTHAVGDYAVRIALDAYENAERVNHTSDQRHRVEHIETITSADIPRFGKLGVIASMQPLHAYPDADTLGVWMGNAGPDRGSRAWPWHSIAAGGGRLAFGSDWNVVTLNPWEGLQNAVTRQTVEGTPAKGFLPQERISLDQAIEAYTLGAAFAGRREGTEGSLESGKLADLIIVSQNVFEIDPHRIAETKVLTTIVGGRVVYQSDVK